MAMFYIIFVVPCQSQKGSYINNKNKDGKIHDNFYFFVI